VFQTATSDEANKRKLFIVVSSDKGLCGGIHSSVTKFTRRTLTDSETVDADSPVMIIGDKSKAQLSRAIGQNLAMTFNQIGRDIPTFADAAGVADLIVKSGVKYDSVAIVYNKFVSSISYEASIVEVLNENGLKNSREQFSCRTPKVSLPCVLKRRNSWLQGLRDGGRRHTRPRRVLFGQRHLCCSR
jgi:F-type H+-transporting ATPase subunit gamma